nr:hypothetical protein [Listeria monocytogenes]
MLKNYYTGFEGYPEIDFYTYINGEKTGIEMWEGYFDNIMNEFSPVDGRWVSLAYYYHLYEGALCFIQYFLTFKVNSFQSFSIPWSNVGVNEKWYSRCRSNERV